MEYGTNYSPEPDKYLIKVVIIGDISVGKTNIIKRILGQGFDNTLSTIGVEFGYITINDIDPKDPNRKLCIQIWDTSGAERYRSITNSHIRNSDGAFIVYDITNEKSFEDISYWHQCIKNATDDDIIIYLLGNKLDLIKEEGRAIEKSEAQRYVRDHGFNGFAECSAKTNENILSTFKKFYETIYEKQKTKLEEKTKKRNKMNSLKVQPRKDLCC